MCGIIGYLGKENAIPIVFEGLKRLEYRGYDSWGIGSISEKRLKIIKQTGKISEAEITKLKPSNIAIAHTRWATHGPVTQANAHPQIDCSGHIAVVHNGIIENWQELKDGLIKNGHKFKSETDTEVIPHLIEMSIKAGKTFSQACIDALRQLQGSWAVLVLKEGERVMIAGRKGSPLVLGISKHGIFASSDIPAFLEHTKQVVYLADFDVAAISENHFSIFNLEKNQAVQRQIDSIEWDIEQARKGQFEHYMLKEITEQVDTIQRAVAQDRDMIEKIAKAIKLAKCVFFVGCGSSYHACIAASYIFSKIARLHINVVLGSEFPNYRHFINQDTLVIAVTQSGETADVLEAISTAKANGAKIISIVNVMGSSAMREADSFLLMNAGLEICVLSTKTYTSQLALLTLLAYALAGQYEEGQKRLKYLWNVVYHLTSATARQKIREIAEKLKDKEHLFLIGRGLQYATALEAALKIKEASYIHAEALAGGELKHGTLALIESGTPCIVFVAKENEREIFSNATEIKARGGYVIGVSENNNQIFDLWIRVPEAGNENPIVQIIPMQILAYELAKLRGCDIDRPRNLAKAVTVK